MSTRTVSSEHTKKVMDAIDQRAPIPPDTERQSKPVPAKIKTLKKTDPHNGWKDQFLVERVCPNAYLPTRGSPEAAGYDLYAFDRFTVPAHGSAIVRTGLRFSFPAGIYGTIRPRSGLAFNKDIQVHIGTIDRDYQGEVRVKLFNLGNVDCHFDKPGERICQLVLDTYISVPMKVIEPNADGTSGIVTLVGQTKRGDGGFGSTGTH